MDFSLNSISWHLHRIVERIQIVFDETFSVFKRIYTDIGIFRIIVEEKILLKVDYNLAVFLK